jgi:hypothetical protein
MWRELAFGVRTAAVARTIAMVMKLGQYKVGSIKMAKARTKVRKKNECRWGS